MLLVVGCLVVSSFLAVVVVVDVSVDHHRPKCWQGWMLISTGNPCLGQVPACIRPCSRGPKGHMTIRMLRSGSKVQDLEDARSHGLKDPYVYGVYWASA